MIKRGLALNANWKSHQKNYAYEPDSIGVASLIYVWSDFGWPKLVKAIFVGSKGYTKRNFLVV